VSFPSLEASPRCVDTSLATSPVWSMSPDLQGLHPMPTIIENDYISYGSPLKIILEKTQT
jgi:hypothetical protein